MSDLPTWGQNEIPPGPGKGNRRVPDEIKQLRKANSLAVELVFQKFLQLNKQELEDLLEDPETTMFERILGRVMVMASQGGDPVRFAFVLERAFGKTPVQTSATDWATLMRRVTEAKREKQEQARRNKQKQITDAEYTEVKG